MNDFNNESNLYNILRGHLHTKSNKINIQTVKPEPKKKKQIQIPERDQLECMMQETNKNVNHIFNSSIKNLQNIMNGLEEPEHKSEFTVQQLLRENNVLKSNLIKMKKILREKLETGLNCQRDELSKILEQYIRLITKLLQDKEVLTNKLKDKELQLYNRDNQNREKLENLKQSNQKLKNMVQERDVQIRNAQSKINEFLVAIEKYEEQGIKQQNKFEQMDNKIRFLEKELQKFSSINQQERGYTQQESNSKIQNLLQLLEQSQKQVSQYSLQLNMLLQLKQQSEIDHENKINELTDQYEEQFMEYEKVMKSALNQKNQQIDRLQQLLNKVKSN